jgi:hypothetical protein
MSQEWRQGVRHYPMALPTDGIVHTAFEYIIPTLYDFPCGPSSGAGTSCPARYLCRILVISV